MTRELARRLRRDDSGLSMTELLVASMLSLLILAMVGNFFISTTKITSFSNDTRASADVASNVMNEIASVVRVATDLSSTSSGYAVVDGSNRSKLVVYAMTMTSATTPAMRTGRPPSS